MRSSNTELYIRLAFDTGYRVRDGKMISHKGTVLCCSSRIKYPQFGFRPSVRSVGKRLCVKICGHQFAAYQKYGSKAFKPGIIVRHRDGNTRNFHHSNILLGTQADNMRDKSPQLRFRIACKASARIRCVDDSTVAAIKSDRAAGMTFKALALKHALSGKGQAHYIVNHDYVTIKHSRDALLTG